MALTKKILVVDDDEETRLLMEKMLAGPDYEVLTAEDGPHAMEKTNQQHLDLILLDNRMPLFSGIWYCNALKRKPSTKNIPVVLMSAGLDEETILKAKEMGAVDYLHKPFRGEDLLKVVRKNIL